MSWIGIFCLALVTNIMRADGLASYRLPGNLRPVHYKLDLATDLEKFDFKGSVLITLNCTKSTSSIVLHSVDLTISAGGVTVNELGPDNSVQHTFKIVDQQQAPKNDFYIVKVDKELKGGKLYQILIPFNGTLAPSLSGYYRSSYLDRASNTTRWLGVTQFEPSDARRAFPCFDEPEMKAKFSIRLAHKDGLTAVSNMPLVKTTPMENQQGWSWDEFQESVPMSTYLVAWMVSDFGNGEAPLRPNNVQFRIWARTEALEQIGFASDVGPKVLEFYEQLFDVKYPLPKQDMAAIPDFSSGAMENWGLITYRETELLYDPKKPSINNQERVAYVVAHELAHQWFGNLVTMKWWTDLWLNEGFATYVGTLGVHTVLPELGYLDEASMNYLTSVYDLDSLKSSHPISVEVGPPSEVSEIFDAISYKKGSTVIRMMHNFLGDSFKTGVSTYLKTHKFGNAEQDDLWAALTEQAHNDKVLAPELTVKQIMDSWTLQTGYPLLTVERDYKTGAAYVTQTRFLRIPPQPDEKINQTCWWFPLTFTTEANPDFNDTSPKQWLKCGEKRVALAELNVPDNQWLILNVQLTGLARVMYDSKNWALISSTLNSDRYKTIGPLNRAGLLLDAFDFAERGDLPYETALLLSAYLSRETELIPLQRGFIALNFLNSMLSRTPNYGTYKRYMMKILLPLYEKYSRLAEIPKETEQIKIHNLLSYKFCHFEIGDCKEQALKLYGEWATADLDKSNPIPFDLQSLVLCKAVKFGGESTWNKVWSRYLQSNLASEKAILLRALGCTTEVWLLNRYLEWSIDETSEIRKQDSLTIFAYVAGYDHGFFLGWDFFQRNLVKIYKYHEPRTNKVGRYLLTLASNIMFQDELDRMNALIEKNKKYFEGAKLQVKQALENAAANVKWHTNNYEQVSTLLKQ